MQIEHKRDQPYYLAFPMINVASPENFLGGLSPTVEAWSKDGAAAWQTRSIADSATGIGASGIYELTIAETSHDQVLVKITAPGAADTAFLLDMRTALAEDGIDSNGRMDVGNWAGTAVNISGGNPQVTTAINSDKSGYFISGVKQTLDVLNDFNPATDAVSNVSTVATVTDKAGYTIAGTKQTLDVLNDFNPASDAVNSVTTVGTVSGNVDGSVASVVASVNAIVVDATAPGLAKWVTEDTGETVAAPGSVAIISQGAAGGNVTVGSMTVAALAQFATDDTGETAAQPGSVAELSKGTGGGSGTPANGPYLPDPVDEAFTRVVRPETHYSGYVDDSLRYYESDQLLFGLDFRNIIPQNSYLAQVKAVNIPAAMTGWTVVPFNTLDGAAWDTVAKVEIQGHLAGQETEIEVVVTTREGRDRTCRVPITIEPALT